MTPITHLFVKKAEADRVEILTGDAIREPITNSYDVIVVRHVIQVLSPEESHTLLVNLAASLNPGGIIHLIGWVLDDSRTTPKNIVGYNLVLLNAYQDGQTYTESEYFGWLVEAGFTNCERIVKSDGASFISAVYLPTD